MEREVQVGFAEEKTKAAFFALRDGKGEGRELYELLDKAIDKLKENPECGVRIPKKLWPKEYVRKYRINNLWKYNLPNGWRFTYTIANYEIMIMAVVLEWFDHKGYERRFKY